MDPKEIFELIVKADEALKYATEEKSAVRAEQARRWLHQARDEAAAIGEGGLVEQADRRLADLDRIAGPDGA
jgi:riboflavin biosynthesis pyrimidine reductase